MLGKAPDSSDSMANAAADAELSRFLTTGKVDAADHDARSP